MVKLHEAFQNDKDTKRVVFNYIPEIPETKKALIIDATLRRTHTSKSNPTENPVEQGIKMTDHVDVLPKEFDIEGVISNSPIELTDALLGNAAGAVGGFIGKKIGSSTVGAVATGAVGTLGGALLNGFGPGRIQKAYQTLQEIQDKAILLTVTERLRSYENMILTDLTVVRTEKTADSLFFTAHLKEIRIVTNDIVQIPKSFLDKAVKHTGTKESDKGTQSPSESTPPTAKQQNRSILKTILN